MGTAGTLAAIVRDVGCGLGSGVGTTKRDRATGSGRRGSSYGAVTCGSVFAVTTTEAPRCGTAPDTNIGRTMETPNAATPARAMTDARRGEKSASIALSARKNHSSCPGTGRGRRATRDCGDASREPYALQVKHVRRP